MRKNYATAVQIEKDGVTQTFKSLHKAANFLGCHPSSVLRAMRRNGKCKDHLVTAVIQAASVESNVEVESVQQA